MIEVEQAMEQIGEREADEWRVFGPPGTGKTTYCARQIRRAVEKHGADAVLVTSFSKAAAQELVSRDLPLLRERVGTLHAHCFHALGSPKVIETTADAIDHWNEEHPSWKMSGGQEDLDDPYETKGALNGDDFLRAANRWRNRLADFDRWPSQIIRTFYTDWKIFKEHHGLLDFTDLLEQARRDCKVAPGNPRVLFLDEAQDSTALQLSIVRQWSRHADYLVSVGDDDQTIYDFIGASPDAFLNPPLPESQKIVLSQSYRVPEAVFEAAMRWIARVSRREPKEYHPRPERGSVEHFSCGYDTSVWQSARIIDAVEREVAEGRTVMLLVTCAYMTGELRKQLLKRAIPFHNPYKRTQANWNPLSLTRGTSAAERVLSFIKSHPTQGGAAWTAADYRKFAEWLIADQTFRRGGKTAAKDLDAEEQITIEQLKQWLEKPAYEALITGIMRGTLSDHMEWWASRIMPSHEHVARFPVSIIRERGVKALAEKPKVIIGTIHSVKGGEADTVFLFPDLSPAADREWHGASVERRDSIIRTFYVGMTRARQKLVICPPHDFRAYRVTGLG